jgi:hypothetical protein
MQLFKAHVRNGRLLLDEPTDLPEGDVVHLQQVDAAAVDEGMSDEEREDLFQALDEAIESVRPPEPAGGEESGDEPPARA